MDRRRRRSSGKPRPPKPVAPKPLVLPDPRAPVPPGAVPVAEVAAWLGVDYAGVILKVMSGHLTAKGGGITRESLLSYCQLRRLPCPF